MSLFFYLKGLVMAFRGAQTIQHALGFGLGSLTPHIPKDLTQKIASDFKYDSVEEIVVDLAGLAAGGVAGKLGGKFPGRVISTGLARRAAIERLGEPEVKTFLGIIPKPFLPVAALGLASADKVLDMVNEGLDIGGSLLRLGAADLTALPGLVGDVKDFVTSASNVYEGLGDLGTFTLDTVRDWLQPTAESIAQSEVNFETATKVGAAIGAFVGDIAHGFQDLTNPLLHREPTVVRPGGGPRRGLESLSARLKRALALQEEEAPPPEEPPPPAPPPVPPEVVVETVRALSHVKAARGLGRGRGPGISDIRRIIKELKGD